MGSPDQACMPGCRIAALWLTRDAALIAPALASRIGAPATQSGARPRPQAALIFMALVSAVTKVIPVPVVFKVDRTIPLLNIVVSKIPIRILLNLVGAWIHSLPIDRPLHHASGQYQGERSQCN